MRSGVKPHSSCKINEKIKEIGDFRFMVSWPQSPWKINSFNFVNKMVKDTIAQKKISEDNHIR